LVRPAGLQGAGVSAVELEVVVTLELWVGEVGEGQTALARRARRDGLLRWRPIERKVLAHIAEEIDGGELRGPIEVVDDLRGMGAIEVEELLALGADLRHPLLDDLARVERPLPRHPRIADEAGGPTDEGERVVAGLL